MSAASLFLRLALVAGLALGMGTATVFGDTPESGPPSKPDLVLMAFATGILQELKPRENTSPQVLLFRGSGTTSATRENKSGFKMIDEDRDVPGATYDAAIVPPGALEGLDGRSLRDRRLEQRLSKVVERTKIVVVLSYDKERIDLLEGAPGIAIKAWIDDRGKLAAQIDETALAAKEVTITSRIRKLPFVKIVNPVPPKSTASPASAERANPGSANK